MQWHKRCHRRSRTNRSNYPRAAACRGSARTPSPCGRSRGPSLRTTQRSAAAAGQGHSNARKWRRPQRLPPAAYPPAASMAHAIRSRARVPRTPAGRGSTRREGGARRGASRRRAAGTPPPPPLLSSFFSLLSPRSLSCFLNYYSLLSPFKSQELLVSPLVINPAFARRGGVLLPYTLVEKRPFPNSLLLTLAQSVPRLTWIVWLLLLPYRIIDRRPPRSVSRSSTPHVPRSDGPRAVRSLRALARSLATIVGRFLRVCVPSGCLL